MTQRCLIGATDRHIAGAARPLNRCRPSSGTHRQMKEKSSQFTVADALVAQPPKAGTATKACATVQRIRYLSVAVSAGGKDGIQEVRGSIPLSSTSVCLNATSS